MKQGRVQPDVVIWTSLLAACRTQGDTGRAQRIHSIVQGLPARERSPQRDASSFLALGNTVRVSPGSSASVRHSWAFALAQVLKSGDKRMAAAFGKQHGARGRKRTAVV